MARTLDLNFGLRVDHYLAIDTQTFVRMIDTVGGVDINVESPIDLNYGMETPDPRYYLSAGKNHLDGELALSTGSQSHPVHIPAHEIPENHPERAARKATQP